MKNSEKIEMDINKFNKNLGLIAEVVEAFRSKPMDLTTSVYLNELYAENQVFLVDYGRMLQDDVLKLTEENKNLKG